MSVDRGSGVGGPVSQHLMKMAVRFGANPTQRKINEMLMTANMMLAKEIDSMIEAVEKAYLHKSAPTENGGSEIESVTTNTCGNTADEKRLAPGEPCPTCGQRTRPMTNAERQRRYRERKKDKPCP